ncbi:MAG: hypothetical protein KGO48_16335 [Alphaproteobacteria bacterium]|nr:hypothetical protein [Alphaproteobacteria bacterium]
MKLATTVIAAATAFLATHAVMAQQAPAAAPPPQQETCLQNNRIWQWNAVNDRLLIVTDRTYHRFIVRLAGGCIGLSIYPLVALQFYTWTNLGCLGRGDQVIYRSPDLGRLNCFINDVQPYSDALLAQAKDDSAKKD